MPQTENHAEWDLRSLFERLGWGVTNDEKARRGRILIGTASWSDPGFVEHWYPKRMAARERLGWYAHHFEMVEVNSTFYSVPEPRLVEGWCRNTPDRFTFDMKLHQLLSRHSTTAKFLPATLQKAVEIDSKGKVILTPDVQSAVIEAFIPVLSILRGAGKLGALLLQLSPAFSPRDSELAQLEPVIERLNNYDLAIEFRNRNWAIGDRLGSTIQFLRKRNIAFVSVDAPQSEHFTIMPSDVDEVTNSRLAYLRLHGRNARAYITGKTVASRFNYDYNDDEIGEIAARAEHLAEDAAQVHVVFNNNALDYAPRAALRLRKALDQIVSTPAQTLDLF